MVVARGWKGEGGERKVHHFLNVCPQRGAWCLKPEWRILQVWWQQTLLPVPCSGCRLQTAFFPFNNRRDGKEKASFGPRGFFFFFFNGPFRSNLHLRGRETIFCYHSISLKFKNSWGYFSWFIKFTSFQRNLPANLSLPQRLGLQESPGSWIPSTWVHCFGLSLWSLMLEYLFLRVKEKWERNQGIEMNLSSQFFSVSGEKESHMAATAKD